MDDPALFDHFRAESARFVDLLEAADPAAPVPDCPRWTVQRLADHLGRVQRSVTAMLRVEPGQPLPALGHEHAPEGPELLAWLNSGNDELAEALAVALDAGLGAEVIQTWFGPQPRRFWVRRMAHEASVHRHDLGTAVGAAEPIDPALAGDGLDELGDVFMPNRVTGDQLATIAGTSVHLHATDLDGGSNTHGEWMWAATPTGISVSYQHGKGDLAVRASTSDLLLWGWGRKPSKEPEVFGKAALMTAWRSALTF